MIQNFGLIPKIIIISTNMGLNMWIKTTLVWINFKKYNEIILEVNNSHIKMLFCELFLSTSG